VGSTANAITRPDVTAGPIERNRSPEKTDDAIGSGGVGDGLGVEGLGVGVVGTVVTLVESPAGEGEGVRAAVGKGVCP